MAYPLLLLAPDGEEYPYAESLNDGSYGYRISVVWEGRDGELNVSPAGAHVAFDDDGSWLLFPVVPHHLFPDQKQLAPADLLHLLNVLTAVAQSEPEQLGRKSASEIETAYQRYLQNRDQTDSGRVEDGFPPDASRTFGSRE